MFFKKLFISAFILFGIMLAVDAQDGVKYVKPSEPQISTEKLADDNSGVPFFTPFQFAFFSPLQVFPDYFNVYGLRLNLPYGSNNTIYGLDVGFANTCDTQYGLNVAVFLSRRKTAMYGISFAGIFSISQGDDIGLSMAGFYNETGTIRGLQTALLCNQTKHVKGVQLGLYNYAREMDGVQIGILNYCKAQPFKYTLFFNFWESAWSKKKIKNK